MLTPNSSTSRWSTELKTGDSARKRQGGGCQAIWVAVLSEVLWLAQEKLQRQEVFPGMRRTPGCVHGQNASDSHLRLVKNFPKAQIHYNAGRRLN